MTVTDRPAQPANWRLRSTTEGGSAAAKTQSGTEGLDGVTAHGAARPNGTLRYRVLPTAARLIRGNAADACATWPRAQQIATGPGLVPHLPAAAVGGRRSVLRAARQG
jgi:hypothetical protein